MPYEFGRYVSFDRWVSYWHQIKRVLDFMLNFSKFYDKIKSILL